MALRETGPCVVEVPAPCVIMSHGFGGTQDCLLERYIPPFVDAGLAVLTYFGVSEWLFARR